MPPKAKTQEQLISDKNHMIDEAVKLIATFGLEKFSIRKLSQHLGMSPANMYNYFYSKDEVYIFIRIRGFNLLHQKYDKLVSRLSDPIERVEGYVRAFISFGNEYPGYYHLMFNTTDPKSLDYRDSPLDDLAKTEKANAMKSFFYLQDLIRDCMPGIADANLYTTTTRIICEIHGVISLNHSNIILEISSDINNIIENLIHHISMEFRLYQNSLDLYKELSSSE